MLDSSILWRRLDQPGHEAARLIRQPGGWQLAGAAVFTHDHRPCRLDYRVNCDKAWQTLSAQVSGWVGNETIAIELEVVSGGRWHLNGIACPDAEGCIDLDLNFSPSTNLLPIRRLDLAVGQAASVKAAWLRFPGFALEALEQVYARLDATTYRYESAGGRFVRELQVNAAGFIAEYPDFWAMEAAS